MWWKQHKWKVIVPAAVLAALAIAFWYGGDAPGLQGWQVQPQPENPPEAASPAETPPAPAGPPEAVQPLPEQPPRQPAEPAPGEPAPQGPQDPPDSPPQPPEGTSEPPAGNPEPPSGPDGDPPPQNPPPQEPATPPEQPSGDPVCTLSVSCRDVFDHLDWLAEGKEDILPEDGWIYPEAQVTFTPGESVFDLLQREMKAAGVPMEFSNTPMYQSAYIEGIANLYEFDCGELSGWLYLVNGQQYSYGSSRQLLQAGDRIEWVFSCDKTDF